MAEYLDSLVVTWPWWALMLTIAVSILALGKGADWLVEDAVVISLRWGVPQVVIGATVISLGTTTPEAVVSVLAAVNGRSEMALGNAVGSIICDTGLILGIGCLIAPLPLDPRVVNRQGWAQIATGVLLVAACLPWADPLSAFSGGGRLPQAVGFLLLGLLVLYLGWSVHLAREAPTEAPLDAETGRRTLLWMAMSLMAGLATVVIASSLLIPSAAELANRLNVPPSIIAATLVAFGTSLPELMVVVTAARKGQGDLAIGNVIGADILNVLFVRRRRRRRDAGRARGGPLLLPDAVSRHAFAAGDLPGGDLDGSGWQARASLRPGAVGHLPGGHADQLSPGGRLAQHSGIWTPAPQLGGQRESFHH